MSQLQRRPGLRLGTTHHAPVYPLPLSLTVTSAPSMGQSMSPVPQELVDMITTYLWDDPTALCYCALVSTRFHFLAQKLLYRKLVIGPPGALDTTQTRITSSHLLFVLSKRPEYAKYVQDVSIIAECDDKGKSWLESDETLERILPRLTNLAQFAMVGCMDFYH